MKKSKEKIISTIIILIILVSSILQVANATDNNSRNINENEMLEEMTTEYESSLYDVVQASILTSNPELLEMEDIESINKNKFAGYGIWVEEESREYFLNLVNTIEGMNFKIDNRGYLQLDGENQKQTDYISISLRKLINIDRTIIISIQDTFLSYEEEFGELVTKSINDGEYYIQLMDEEDSSSEILLLNKNYYSDKNNENTEEKLIRYILEVYYKDDITSEITEGMQEHLLAVNSKNANMNSRIANAVNTNIYISEESQETILTFINLNSNKLYNVNSNGYLTYANTSNNEGISQIDSEIQEKVKSSEEIIIEINSIKFSDDNEYVKSEELNGIKYIYLNPNYFNSSTIFFDNTELIDSFTKNLMSIEQETIEEMLVKTYNEVQNVKATYSSNEIQDERENLPARIISGATTTTMKSGQTVYFGPNSSDYASVGSVDAGETILVTEEEEGWIYIMYVVGSTGTHKSGFVPKSTVNYSGTPPQVDYSNGYAGATTSNTSVSYGLNTLGGVFQQVGTVFGGEGITILEITTGSAYIEYSSSSGTKRGFITTTALQNIQSGKIGRINSSTNAYTGPDVNYIQAGTIFTKEVVVGLEKDDDYYYVEYNSTAGRKRGYVSTGKVAMLGTVSNVSGVRNIKISSSASTAYYGPNSEYASVGSISSNEIVNVIKTNDRGYAFIEYETSTYAKRGYVPASTVTTTYSVSIPSITVTGNITKEKYGTSGNGRDLNAYKIGNGNNVLVAVFALHGFEDAWPADGVELTKMAKSLVENLNTYKSNGGLSDWTVYVIQAANPDAVLEGWSSNGPGRAAVASGIDLNRSFPTAFSPQYSRRYYTSANSLVATESSSLASYLQTIKTRHVGTAVLVDIHGWLNQTIGNSNIGQYFSSQFNISSHSSSYGSGYLINYSRSLGYDSALIELPKPSSTQQIINNNYSGKINAAIKDLVDNYGQNGTIVNESVIVIASPTLNLRSYPGLSEYNKIAEIQGGTIITRIIKSVCQADGHTWDKVRLNNGQEGYVATNYLELYTSGSNEVAIGSHVYIKDRNYSLATQATLNSISNGDLENGKMDIVELYENWDDLEEIYDTACGLGLILDFFEIFPNGRNSLANYLKISTHKYNFHHSGKGLSSASAGDVPPKVTQLQGEAIQAAEQMVGSHNNQFTFALAMEETTDFEQQFSFENKTISTVIQQYANALEGVDWYFAIGVARIQLVCDVEKTGNNIAMTMTYTIKDYYDWNKEKTNQMLGCISQEELWRLNFAGFAKNFNQTTTFVKVIEWTAGNTSTATVTSSYSL